MFSKEALQKKLRLLPIDFSKPWWHIIVQQKWLFVAIVIIFMLVQIFWTLVPFLIAKTLESGMIWIYGLLFLGWLGVDFLNAYARQLNTRFQLQCIHSIYQNAHRFLLTIDPHYHVHRSSGAVLGKIERAARGYEELLDQITFELAPLLISLITIVVILSSYSLWLAVFIACSFTGMICGGYFFARYRFRYWEKGFIETDDAFRAAAVENLTQIQLVRATFASDYISDKLTKSAHANMRSESRVWLSYITASYILNMFYTLTVFCLLGVLFWQIKIGVTSIVSAMGLVLAYINGTRELIKIIKPFRRYMRGWTAVTDLFDFIPTFGSQTYPVIGPAVQLDIKDDVIEIEAQNISFAYGTATIFNNHTLNIKTKRSDAPNLYGIIGPSGSGKTTLLSILGGQLKPVQGSVTINGIDIYSITDATRRNLIALQGQTATNLKGTVKYNMLFGLPSDHGYDDEFLNALLKRVGLFSVLKDGLNTSLGEGGLNLSGGQRQRLNFAGLYLRACYYKPLLILIDEPTSSLDELSEAAITQMITELSSMSVTLVVAHRLKTLEDAKGLIDLSLIGQDQEIVPYTAAELYKRSAYFKALKEHKIALDS